MLNHHFIWFLFCFGFAQKLAKMRLFVSSCREGLRLSFLLVLGLFLLPGEPKRRGGLPLPPQLSLGVAVGLGPLVPGCPQPGLPRGPGSGSGREVASASVHSPIRSLGLGEGRAALVLFFGEDIEFHARCFMYYIYNINISKSVLVSL